MGVEVDRFVVADGNDGVRGPLLSFLDMTS
jgi:hypothetical protein